MLEALSFFVAIVFLAGHSQLDAEAPLTAPKPPQPSSETLLPETKAISDAWLSARIVRDLASFDLAAVDSRTTGAWMVARILPGGLSGSLSLQGVYLKDGKAYDSGIRPREVIRAGGQWWLIQLISGTAPPSEGRFQWTEPARNFDWDRETSLLDMSSVFTSPKIDATVVCQFFEKKSGAAQFADVTSIPAEWKTFAKPAYEYYLKHTDEFTGKDLDKLRQLAAGENPFLSLKAMDLLLSHSKTDDDVNKLADLARSLTEYQQAVFVLKLLIQTDEKSHNLVLKVIGRARNTTELAGIALGIQTWILSKSGIMFLMPPQSVVKAVHEKWRSYDPSVPDDWNQFLTQVLFKPETPKR